MKETKELGDETVFLFHLLIKNSEENIEVSSSISLSMR